MDPTIMQTKIVKIYGQIRKIELEKASMCAKDLFENFPSMFREPEIFRLIEFDWSIFISKMKREIGGLYWNYSAPVIVVIDGEIIGDDESFAVWAKKNLNWHDHRPTILYNTLAHINFVREMYKRNLLYAKMSIAIDGEICGDLVFELYRDLLPKTCENFRALCTGEMGTIPKNELQNYKMKYEGTKFFRLVKHGWIQGGDIMYNRGNDGYSIYGPTFEDENFGVKHDARGILSMANAGRHTNASQFFITLAPTPWMDKLYVAFGRVIIGSATLDRMEAVPTDNERPTQDISIVKCQIITGEDINHGLV